MLELKALASFIVICQQPSLTRAADKLGVATSSLSETLKGLEGETGVTLFDRKAKGLVLTEPGKWLYRFGLNVLHAESFTRRFLRAGSNVVKLIEIRIQLPFTMGRLAQAVSRAIEAAGSVYPEVCFRIAWCRDDETRREDTDAIAHTVIELRYLRPEDRDTREPIFVDKLILVGGNSRAEWLPGAQLRGPVVVPQMADPLHQQVQDRLTHLKRIGNAEFVLSTHDLGALPTLELDWPDALFLVPASAVAERHRPAPPYEVGVDGLAGVPIIGTVSNQEPAADQLIKLLRNALRDENSTITFDPRVTARQLGYFEFLLQTRTITGAAKLATVAQPSVTDQLAKLEHILDGLLFHRTKGGLELTDAGGRFHAASKLLNTALMELKLARPGVVSSAGGRVVLGILPSVGPYGFLISRVTKAVEAWRSRHPSIQLRIIEDPNAVLQERILQGTLDLGVITTKSPRMARFDLGSSEALSLIVNPKFNLIGDSGTVDFSRLMDLPLVLPTPQFGMRQLIDTAGQTRGIVLRPTIEVESLSMCVALVLESALCTILPASDVQIEIKKGTLVSYIVESPEITRTLQIIYSAKRALTQAERGLVELLRLHLNTNEIRKL